MFIDTHCHLTFSQFDPDREIVIKNAIKAGIKAFIIPGASIATTYDAVNYANSHDHCYASVGSHPYEVRDKPDIACFSKLLGPKVIAVGECGLDYYLFKGFSAEGKKIEQKILFEQQLRLALTHNLPVIIHCRDAYDDIFDILDSLPTMPKGVFHCFGGAVHDVKEVEKRGFYFGIDGNVTYSKQLALTVPLIPLDKLLLETDAPLLPPTPHRGERNEPKYIPLIAQKIAELKQCTIEEIETVTTDNAIRLFSLHTIENAEI